MRSLAAALAAFLLAAGPASAAEPGIGGRAALAQLNAQRAANGIPGDVTFDEQAAAGCALHARWMELNGRTAHEEPPGSPGYTEAGAAAGMSSVLGGVWSNPGAGVYDSNPYENAPIHLMQLLAPRLSSTGIWGPCASTWPGYDRPAPPQPVILTYPGNGTTGIYTEMVAGERPFVPGDFVGLPQGTRTGPHLYVLPMGMAGRILVAELHGPRGAVDVRVVDKRTPSVGAYLPDGGIVIPTKPLEPGLHTAAVMFEATTVMTPGPDWDYQPRLARFTHRWTFTAVEGRAGGDEVESAPPSSRLRARWLKARWSSRRLDAGLLVSGAPAGSRAKVKVRWTRGSRRAVLRSQSRTLRAGRATFRLRVPRGAQGFRVSLSSVRSGGRALSVSRPRPLSRRLR